MADTPNLGIDISQILGGAGFDPKYFNSAIDSVGAASDSMNGIAGSILGDSSTLGNLARIVLGQGGVQSHAIQETGAANSAITGYKGAQELQAHNSVMALSQILLGPNNVGQDALAQEAVANEQLELQARSEAAQGHQQLSDLYNISPFSDPIGWFTAQFKAPMLAASVAEKDAQAQEYSLKKTSALGFLSDANSNIKNAQGVFMEQANSHIQDMTAARKSLDAANAAVAASEAIQKSSTASGDLAEKGAMVAKGSAEIFSFAAQLQASRANLSMAEQEGSSNLLLKKLSAANLGQTVLNEQDQATMLKALKMNFGLNVSEEQWKSFGDDTRTKLFKLYNNSLDYQSRADVLDELVNKDKIASDPKLLQGINTVAELSTLAATEVKNNPPKDKNGKALPLDSWDPNLTKKAIVDGKISERLQGTMDYALYSQVAANASSTMSKQNRSFVNSPLGAQLALIGAKSSDTYAPTREDLGTIAYNSMISYDNPVLGPLMKADSALQAAIGKAGPGQTGNLLTNWIAQKFAEPNSQIRSALISNVMNQAAAVSTYAREARATANAIVGTNKLGYDDSLVPYQTKIGGLTVDATKPLEVAHALMRALNVTASGTDIWGRPLPNNPEAQKLLHDTIENPQATVGKPDTRFK